MHPEKSNPVAGFSAGPGNALSLPGSISENNTHPLAINRLRTRFGLSEPVAALVANLAGLGPQAVR
jgi:hypothetical protein